MPRIKVIEPGEASGRLKDIYDDLIIKRGKLADVHKIQSLRPESITAHMDLYMEIMFSRSELSRAQREMIAVVVSSSNGCDYCLLHHGEALNHYWKDKDKINLLADNYRNASFLAEVDFTLCQFANELTKAPQSFVEEKKLQELKKAGFSDEAILDATLVISYFNFVNRMVLALGLEASKEELSGYNY